jgi:two-component sensor histidine kinase
MLFAAYYFYKKLHTKNKIIQYQKQEILHNNRNNIQQLISIFSMQSENTENKALLIANQERLYTLNLLNRLLYENSETNAVSMETYVNELGNAKQISSGNVVDIKIYCPNITLSPNIMKDIGLIINELTTNSIKYAFTNIAKPIITIDVKQEAKVIKILIADNGNGLPDDFDINNNRKSFGLDFVKDLVEQHYGSIIAYNKEGAIFEISLKS